MQHSENFVEVRGLSKKCGTTQVLHGIDFSMPKGRIYGLIGHNGAGKTTAINALLGLTSYEGSVSVLGLEPACERVDEERDLRSIELLHPSVVPGLPVPAGKDPLGGDPDAPGGRRPGPRV